MIFGNFRVEKSALCFDFGRTLVGLCADFSRTSAFVPRLELRTFALKIVVGKVAHTVNNDVPKPPFFDQPGKDRIKLLRRAIALRRYAPAVGGVLIT